MTDFIAKAEVEFRVGEVLVALWHNPIRDSNDKRANSHKITIERKQPPGHGSNEYTNVLEAGDIPKAILALKKAHDYIQTRRKEGQLPEEFKSAIACAPHRIP